ncbi:hypothetical protein Pelo_14821 [Pelomyxa schiedti]|nr:hypothetical protein Pelo_14821 [Pelomyxa schiedti]
MGDVADVGSAAAVPPASASSKVVSPPIKIEIAASAVRPKKFNETFMVSNPNFGVILSYVDCERAVPNWFLWFLNKGTSLVPTLSAKMALDAAMAVVIPSELNGVIQEEQVLLEAINDPGIWHVESQGTRYTAPNVQPEVRLLLSIAYIARVRQTQNHIPQTPPLMRNSFFPLGSTKFCAVPDKALAFTSSSPFSPKLPPQPELATASSSTSSINNLREKVHPVRQREALGTDNPLLCQSPDSILEMWCTVANRYQREHEDDSDSENEEAEDGVKTHKKPAAQSSSILSLLSYWKVVPENCFKITIKTYESRLIAVEILTKKHGNSIIYVITGKKKHCSCQIDMLVDELNKVKQFYKARLPFESLINTGKNTDDILTDMFLQNPGCTCQNMLLHVYDVKHPSTDNCGQLIIDAFQKLKQIMLREVCVIISGKNPLIEEEAGLPLLYYKPILNPIITSRIAHQMMWHLFKAVNSSSLWADEPDKSKEQMKKTSGSLYAQPDVIHLFLEMLKIYCGDGHGTPPDMKAMIEAVWKEKMMKIKPDPVMEGKEMMEQLRAQIHDELIQIGNVLNNLGLSCFIPLEDGYIRIYLPFCWTSTFFSDNDDIKSSPDSNFWLSTKPINFWLFEKRIKHALTIPGSFLLHVSNARTPFHSHFNLREGCVTFDLLETIPPEWILSNLIGCKKNDVISRQSSEATDYVSIIQKNQYQVAGSLDLAALEQKTFKWWEAALLWPESSTYTMIARSEIPLSTRLRAFLEGTIRVKNLYWKQFQILAGSELWCFCPEAFIQLVRPADRQLLFPPNSKRCRVEHP